MIRSALIVLALTAPAMAQSPEAISYAALEQCAQAKALEYAPLDGTLTEIAAAAISACGEHRQAIKDGLQAHYERLGMDLSRALVQAGSTTDGLVETVAEGLLGTIAESRLAP